MFKKIAHKNKLTRTPLIFFFFIFLVPNLQAANYYVATTGNDSNPGTLSQPWRTISKAAANLIAGDTLYIRGGTYKEQVTPRNSGNGTGGIITYTSYPGETVTIDGSAGLNWNWNGVFDLSNRSYLQISGLRITNSPGFGFYLSDSTNMKILNNLTYNTIYSGIFAYHSNTITISGNEVALANNGGGSQESISLNNTQNFTVSNNKVHGGGKEGIDAKVGSSNGKIFGNNVYDMARVGIYVDAWDTTADSIEIYNNMVSNSKSANSGASEDGIRIGAEHGGTASNIKIYNNVLYNIAQTGIILSNYFESGYSEPKFSGISIFNNTTYNTGLKGGGGILIQGSRNSTITVKNNIVSKASSFNIVSSSAATISNNLFDGGSSTGSNAIMGNPLFVAVDSNNFHLQSNSPAINKGSTTDAPAFDFDFMARPQGGITDIGAFEFASSTVTTPPSPTTTPSSTTALPDVIVTSISYANGVFSCTVKNQGAAATPSNVEIGVGYFVDGVKRTWGTVYTPLAPGASVTIYSQGGKYYIPTGGHTIRAFVDDVNRFAESNESNNNFSRWITVP
ncbi:MAG: right-handed parallel beta-helix repeat-containing protein [Bdellovibrio sp.]